MLNFYYLLYEDKKKKRKKESKCKIKFKKIMWGPEAGALDSNLFFFNLGSPSDISIYTFICRCTSNLWTNNILGSSLNIIAQILAIKIIYIKSSDQLTINLFSHLDISLMKITCV